MIIFTGNSTTGIISAKKVCRNLGMTAILEMSNYSTNFQFDISYENIVPNYVRKSIFIMMTSAVTSRCESKLWQVCNRQLHFYSSFSLTVFQAYNKGNIKVPNNSPLLAETNVDHWILFTKGQ